MGNKQYNNDGLIKFVRQGYMNDGSTIDRALCENRYIDMS